MRTASPRSANIPRIVVAAASSGAGKTTISLGIIGALRRRGLRVVAAKCGPDFIDAAHLTRVSGSTARNLDAWLVDESALKTSFGRAATGADIAIIEGVMGLFDGRHDSGEGSSAHVARLLGAPVLLVLDCAKASSTIGAIAYGLARFDARLSVAGAILNNVASERHARTVADAVRCAGVPVLGVVRRSDALALESRHLGLLAPGEGNSCALYAAAADVAERDIDLDALLATTADLAPVIYDAPAACEIGMRRVRVALAQDDAFWFYDAASLEALVDAGADVVPYSPLRDAFPNVDAALIGGGYPELHAEALSANTAAVDGLHRAIDAGMPVYAECGGLMYLSRALETPDRTYPMVGAVPATATMLPRRSALRYVEATTLGAGPMFAPGETVRGHEFHYSQTRYDRAAPAFALEGTDEGYAHDNVHGSYVHVHLGGHLPAVAAFVERARAFGAAR